MMDVQAAVEGGTAEEEQTSPQEPPETPTVDIPSTSEDFPASVERSASPTLSDTELVDMGIAATIEKLETAAEEDPIIRNEEEQPADNTIEEEQPAEMTGTDEAKVRKGSLDIDVSDDDEDMNFEIEEIIRAAEEGEQPPDDEDEDGTTVEGDDDEVEDEEEEEMADDVVNSTTEATEQPRPNNHNNSVVEVIDDDNNEETTTESRKRPRVENTATTTSTATYPPFQLATAPSKPAWLAQPQHNSTMAPPTTVIPPSGISIPGYYPTPTATTVGGGSFPSTTTAPISQLNTPIYVDLPTGFVPTWKHLVPSPQIQIPQPPVQKRRAFSLSLLNVNYFTITGLPVSYDGIPTSISGLRSAIKSISKEHGKASYQRDAASSDNSNSGKWRIPLGAYQAFFTYLQSQPFTTVQGIPPHQLQVASVERARQERGYPSASDLVEKGLPVGLASALAPFQRGGVDFVIAKNGRALIADGALKTSVCFCEKE